jgi:hypothetical protein
MYFLSFFVLIGTASFVIFKSREFILDGQGIGIYGAIIYYVCALISSALWAASYFLLKNKMRANIYWVTAIIITTFFVLQPTWWSAP